MSYAVVIVNWNGADDTWACLASFLDASPDAVAIVIDNGSRDASVEQLTAALQGRGIEPLQLHGNPVTMALAADPSSRVALVEVGENLGFAAGCNLGLRLAHAAGFGVTLFLNNDTIVEPGALDQLVQRLALHNDCFACLPMLTVHGTDRIWNCGGEIYAVGVRRYHLANRPRSAAQGRGEIRCSFFTGCCFAVRTGDFMARRGFSERFFFGEEDFELALWMKDRALSAVCLTTAVVQHKVSASFNRAAAERQSAKVFVYYLNRFIHMRLRLGLGWWCLWVAAYLPYTVALLLRTRCVSLGQMPMFIGSLLRRARAMDRVTRSDFEAMMRGRAEP